MAVNLNNQHLARPVVQEEDPEDDNGGCRGCCGRIRSIILHPNTILTLLAASGISYLNNQTREIESSLERLQTRFPCSVELVDLIESHRIGSDRIATNFDTNSIDDSDACRLKLTPARFSATSEIEMREVETLGFPRYPSLEEAGIEGRWSNSAAAMRTIRGMERFGTVHKDTWLEAEASIGLCKALLSKDADVRGATRSYVTAAIENVKPELAKLKRTFNPTSFRSFIQRAEDLVNRTFFGTFSTNLTHSSNNEKNQ